jgi:AbrB family transcriptional regulator (stage V sporulation protein T)
VVIPKELRRTMKIREGDPLEIFTESNDGLILKKYSPAKEMTDFAEKLAASVAESSGLPVLISDKDTIIAVSGAPKKDYINFAVSSNLEEVMTARKPVLLAKEKVIPLKDGDSAEYIAQAAAPILAEGDIYGCVVVFSKDGGSFGEAGLLLAKATAAITGSQLV